MAALARPGSPRRPGARKRRESNLGRVAQRVLAWERAPANSHVDITLLSPLRMRRLNARATGRRGLTDVIAYPLPQPDGRMLGDVYICPEAAAREAKNGVVGGGGGLDEELVRLAVHGTLHVLGYDHPEGSGRTRSAMWRRQERYVRRLLHRS
ncbi:MAG TPA: rRNA maturation RNase YbeY [Gemmatimonadales bacterium]|nr:rRNA maturation RNase YbeY [Gemmatimonadales bacterium]